MTLGTIVTNVLSHLQSAEFANDPWPQQEADKKCRQAGINGPKRNVPKYVTDIVGDRAFVCFLAIEVVMFFLYRDYLPSPISLKCAKVN
jgi:hypothetical protein